MRVVKVAQEDIAHKIDTAYIREQFSHIDNVGVTFVCTKDKREEDDWIDEDGIRQIVILLPYDEVKKSEDVRPMMLKKAKERLSQAA